MRIGDKAYKSARVSPDVSPRGPVSHTWCHPLPPECSTRQRDIAIRSSRRCSNRASLLGRSRALELDYME